MRTQQRKRKTGHSKTYDHKTIKHSGKRKIDIKHHKTCCHVTTKDQTYMEYGAGSTF